MVAIKSACVGAIGVVLATAGVSVLHDWQAWAVILLAAFVSAV